MSHSSVQSTKRILSILNYTGLDKVYQQIGDELGIILTFHHVEPHEKKAFAPNAHLTVAPEFFESVILMLKRRGFEFISMDQVRERVMKPTRGSRFVAFTFDDGYRNNLEYAVPIMRKHEVPYTIYCTPGFIEGTSDLWWAGLEDLVRQQDRLLLQTPQGPQEFDCRSTDQKRKSYAGLMDYMFTKLPEEEQRQKVRELCWLYKIDLKSPLKEQIMTWDELRDLQSDPLCTLGAHTLTHPALARLDEKKAREEMVQSASILEAELRKRPRHFAYPYGYPAAAAKREFQIAQTSKFLSAVTTRPGLIYPGHKSHMTALPRISVNGLFQRLRYMAPLTTGLPTRLKNKLRRLDVA